MVRLDKEFITYMLNIVSEESLLTSKLDELLEFLAHDGAQHSVHEIAKAIDVPLQLCKDMTVFLAKYEFIQFNKNKVRINPHIRQLISTTFNRNVSLTPFT